MRVKNKLYIESLMYTIGDFGSRLINFLLLPLLTNFLTKEEFGKIDFLYTTFSLIMPIITLYLSSSLYRELIIAKEKNKIKVILSSNFLLQVALNICFLFVTVVLIKLGIIDINNITYIILFYLNFVLNNFLNQCMRGLDKVKLYSIINFFKIIIYSLLSYIFVIYYRRGYLGLILAGLFSTAIINVIIIIKINLIKYISLSKIKKTELLKMLKYSVPLLPNLINWWAMNVSDRYFITYFIGLSNLGIYSLSSKFASTLFLLTSGFNKAFESEAIKVYLQKGEIEKNEYFSNMFKKFMRYQFLLMFLGILSIKPFIFFVVNKEYIDSWEYANILLLANIFSSFSLFYGIGYNCSRETKRAVLPTLFSSVINILINLIFLRKYGLIVASLSTLIAYILLWVQRINHTKRYYSIKIDYRYFFKAISLCMLLHALYALNNSFYIYKIVGILTTIILFINLNKNEIYNFLEKNMKIGG